MRRVKRWTSNKPFSLYVGDFEGAIGIALYGQVILHIVEGTLINATVLPAIIKLLNSVPIKDLTLLAAKISRYKAKFKKKGGTR